MLNALQKNKSRQRLFIFLGFVALTLSSAKLRLCLNDGVLSDLFHHGEYFSALVSLIHDTTFIPLTIHGALDYIPGLLSIALFGKGHYFFATELGFALLSCLAAVFLFLLLSRFDLSGPQLIVAGFIIPWMVDYRDLALIILLWLYFVSIDLKTGAKNTSLLLLLGLAGTFNFYWSTNRGIAGTIATGSALLLLSFRDRRYVLPIGAFAISVLALSFVHPVLAFNNYIANLYILAKTSYQWGYGLQAESVVLSIYMALMLSGMNILIFHQLLVGERKTTNIANCLFFIIISVFYYQISTYRADSVHIPMGLIAFVLGISYWRSLRLKQDDPVGKLDGAVLWATTVLTAVAAICYDMRYGIFLVVFLLTFIYHLENFGGKARTVILSLFILAFVIVAFDIAHKHSKGSYKWLPYLFSPPQNALLATKSTQWVSDQLVQYKSQCVFDMTNNGTINALSDLPACSRFSYIVYADRRFEGELIRRLQETRPPVIVYSTDYWSYRIDQRPMPLRFPELDRCIREIYKYERCNEGYCLRYLLPPEGSI